MSDFFKELKRRKVIKTLGVYGASSILISQVVATIFPYLFLPGWTVTFVIVLLIIGFPVTFFLSWTYDLEKDSQTSKSSDDKITNTKKWSLTKKILFPATGFIIMALGGIFWFIYPFLSISMGHDKEYDASIAILYMENMSSEENSYFADGLTEELITRLSRIQNLKVRPRTDVAVVRANNVPMGMNEIASKLNVNYIVEGSVRIADENLRVTVQLFDIELYKTIWSETYNNKLTGILNIQDKIAGSIVAQLNAKLTITKSDLQATKRISTQNLEAYNLIQKAYKHISNPIYSPQIISEKIEPLVQTAIKLDSTYGEAYATASLAKLYKWMGVSTEDDSVKLQQEIKDINIAELLAKTALQHDEDNILALAILVYLPMWQINNDVSEENKIIIIRTMLLDAQKLIRKHPDDLFSQYVYAYILAFRTMIIGGDKEDYQEPLNMMLAIFEKLKNNNFAISHPIEGIVISFIFEHIPSIYHMMGEGHKGMDFIKNNKDTLCKNGTYECLNGEILAEIGNGFYNSYEYKEALEIFNIVIARSKQELEAVGSTEGSKQLPYFRAGMINMKFGNYNKARENYNLAIKYIDMYDITWLSKEVYFSKIGFTYFYQKDYTNASHYFEQAIPGSTKRDSISYILYNTLSELYDEEKNELQVQQTVLQAETWLKKQPIVSERWDSGYHAYMAYWPLYLYYSHLNQYEHASKYLQLAYDSIIDKKIEQYHTHTRGDTDPRFFYCRDIIRTYESSINQ